MTTRLELVLALLKAGGVEDYRDKTFPQQDKFVVDPSQFVAAQCSRRAGKSNGLAIRFFRTLAKYPGCFCPYIALTRQSAHNIMWPVLQEQDEIFKIGFKFTESNLTATHPNGSVLQLFGADTKGFIRRLKGIKTPAAGVDECFHPDTLIETELGERPIKEIQPGDLIKNPFGFSKVIAISRKRVSGCRTLVYGGRGVICSNNHPFFTGRGWVEASQLVKGDKLVTTEFSMSLLREGFSKTQSRQPYIQILRTELLRESSVSAPEIFKGEIRKQSDVQSAHQSKGFSFAKKAWAQTSRAWRQWARPNGPRKEAYGHGSRFNLELFDWVRFAYQGLSDKLQSRPFLSGYQTSNRDRRAESRNAVTTTAGSKEGVEAGFIRLESNSIYESTGAELSERCDFIDLTVEAHPSFSVNGVLVHNCQDFGPHLKSLIDDVLTPATADYKNSWLALTGTPGPVPRGYFFDITEGKRFGYSVHKWTLFDNPYLPNARAFVARIKATQGWDDRNATYLREYMNEWVLDVESLLIKYRQEKNDFAELPRGHWNYILGIDIGLRDADALAVLAWSESTPNIYLVEECITAGQDITALANQIARFQQKYDIQKIVMDTGGLGAKIAEELTRRKHIPVMAADKKRKFENVAFLNDWLSLGQFKAHANSRFAQDSYQVQIDWEKTTPDRLVVKDSFHSDCIDAVLYAFRESPAFTFNKPKERAKYGTKEWAESEEQEMYETALSKAEADQKQAEVDAEWGW